MNCNSVIMPKRYCYCTVCIAGLIDDFFWFGGGGVTGKIYLYWGGGGVMGKKFNDWRGVMQIFNDSSCICLLTALADV